MMQHQNSFQSSCAYFTWAITISIVVYVYNTTISLAITLKSNKENLYLKVSSSDGFCALRWFKKRSHDRPELQRHREVSRLQVSGRQDGGRGCPWPRPLEAGRRWPRTRELDRLAEFLAPLEADSCLRNPPTTLSGNSLDEYFLLSHTSKHDLLHLQLKFEDWRLVDLNMLRDLCDCSNCTLQNLDGSNPMVLIKHQRRKTNH